MTGVVARLPGAAPATHARLGVTRAVVAEIGVHTSSGSGTPGSVWYYSGQPYDSPAEVPNPNDGDTFVDTTTWALFAYWDGAWVYQGVLQGPQGNPGTFITTSYELLAASSWFTEHTYPYMPAVRLVETSEEDGVLTQSDVATSIEYPTRSSVHITFPQPWTGTVYLT